MGAVFPLATSHPPCQPLASFSTFSCSLPNRSKIQKQSSSPPIDRSIPTGHGGATLSEMYRSTRRLQGCTGYCGTMAHRLLRDAQANGWERSDFPIIYESCLGDNPYVCMIWYSNSPHTKLVEYKGHQNWVNVSGEHLVFPGGETQFKHGALHYIDFIQEVVVPLCWRISAQLLWMHL